MNKWIYDVGIKMIYIHLIDGAVHQISNLFHQIYRSFKTRGQQVTLCDGKLLVNRHASAGDSSFFFAVSSSMSPGVVDINLQRTVPLILFTEIR